MEDIKLPSGVILKGIPVSPNDDYMAGSDGQIYSRTKYAGFGRKGYVDWYPLKGHPNGKGYQVISICHENKKITRNVHRLVCMAFHGMPPKSSYQVRHLDGNPKNNLPENLSWGTQIENWNDRQLHGHGIKGENHPMAKLTNFEMQALKWAISKGLCSQHHAAKVLGMSQAGISDVVHRKF
jgi:hypothetical protein